MSRLFVKVRRGTLSPILGSFIIEKDHKPKTGYYEEIVMKKRADAATGALTRPFDPIDATVSGTRDGATAVSISFKDHGDKIIQIDDYDPEDTIADYVAALSTDVPGIGEFSVSENDENTFTVSNPISQTLTAFIVYS